MYVLNAGYLCNFTLMHYYSHQRSMKTRFIIITFLLICISSYAQNNSHSTFYYQRSTLFEVLPTDSNDIVFLGNSITNGAEWYELFNNTNLKNRGISGDVCQGVYDRLETITNGKPNKIFLMIGVNDIARDTSIDSVALGIERIIDKIKVDSPRTRIYVQSILPLNEETEMFQSHSKRYLEIPLLNKKMKEIAREQCVTYIDVYSSLVIPNTDKLDLQYSNDGLHLMGQGYLKWVEVLRPYVEE